jgi:osmotically-inducible protein OsmY
MKRVSLATLTTALLAAATVPLLQGCFPVVAGGAAAGALAISDRRTSGAYVEDEAIEWKVHNRVGQRFGKNTHVNATSFNRHVLLTGEAPDAATRDEVGRIATAVDNVQRVSNELQVAGPSSLASRSNDAYLTTKVKARFVEANKFAATRVKVVTEANTVFLMGIVTAAEGRDAVDLTRTTGGVQRVITLFEEVTPEEARRLDQQPPKQAPAAKSN